MTRSEYLHKVTKQCDYLTDLILEAEKSTDLEQKNKLFSIARSENNKVIRSLSKYISKVVPDKSLRAA